ncbi:hypothetical protein WR25_03902 [Diploscapter pachys]|uniref:Uncharacterized protein n=1 Tax=Diploscapter pachys TaxID=2018661 RepID=A0A2A2JMY1_9BILA|nr:hypothetical protein WR25_03902 [Diploscapter pachys]
MNCARCVHSLVAANGKLYAIRGFQDYEQDNNGNYIPKKLCHSIEEYDSVENKWKNIDLNNGDQSALQEDKTKSQLNLINPPDVIAARGAHQSIYNDSSANGSKSGTSADKIEEFQKSTNEVRNKLTDARDATPIFDDGNEVQQTIDVINVEVFVKFLLEGSSEKYTCILNVSEGANVISLISKTQAKAQWTSENLKLQMVKLCDVGTKQYNDITQFYNSLTVSANQKYEFIFKNEEKSKGVTVNVTANGEPHNGIQFDLVAGSSVQLLIDDAFFKFNQAASTGTINFVEVFNSNFKEWISVDKPYDKTLIDLDCNYSISINYSDTSTISNGSPAQDLINQPTTAPIQTTNLDIPAPSTSEMNAPVPPNRNSFAGQPSAQTNTTLPQEKIIKDEEDSNRATANSTPSGIGDIAQMPGPSDTQCKKNCGGDNIRVTKVEELEDSLEQATTNCRPDVEKRKTRVNLKDKDQNSTHPHDVKKRPSQIEGKTPNDEPKPKQAKKDKPGAMNDIYDMYQLNPSLLTDKDESLISHPDFRLGNIRAAAIECGIHYNKNKKVCHGINDMIRKTVVCLMAQV